MRRRRTTLLEVVDRVIVTLVGLALVAAGTVILAIALNYLDLPDFSAMAETALRQLETWPAAAVIAAAAVVAILGTAFSIRNLLPAHQAGAVSELRLPSGDGTHRTTVQGRALSKAVETDLARWPSVRDSSARLVSVNPLSIDAKVTTSLSCNLDELRNHVAAVTDRLEHALGRSDVRMRIRITFIDKSESRVE